MKLKMGLCVVSLYVNLIDGDGFFEAAEHVHC